MQSHLTAELRFPERKDGFIVGLTIGCLICGDASAHDAAFARHPTDRHILKQDGPAIEHYYQWQHHVRADRVDLVRRVESTLRMAMPMVGA